MAKSNSLNVNSYLTELKNDLFSKVYNYVIDNVNNYINENNLSYEILIDEDCCDILGNKESFFLVDKNTKEKIMKCYVINSDDLYTDNNITISCDFFKDIFHQEYSLTVENFLEKLGDFNITHRSKSLIKSDILSFFKLIHGPIDSNFSNYKNSFIFRIKRSFIDNLIMGINNSLSKYDIKKSFYMTYTGEYKFLGIEAEDEDNNTEIIVDLEVKGLDDFIYIIKKNEEIFEYENKEDFLEKLIDMILENYYN